MEMRNSCAVCSLAIALCLVVCVSANAKVNEGEAKAAVEDAQRAVKTVGEKAQTQLDDAQSVLQKVESSKSAAEAAASKSQAAANDNEEAKAIAANIQSLSDEVVNFHSEAKQKLNTAVSTLTALLASAKDLEGKSTIVIKPNPESSDDYTGANSEAKTLKGQADALNGQIDAAVQLIAGLDSTAENMVKKAKQAQLKDAHVSAIIAVATIDTILGNAATIIGQIEGKKNAVSLIVGEMQTLKTNNPTVSGANIEALHQSADNALIAATGALDNANRAKTNIETQKGLANGVLTKVKEEKREVSEAQKEVQKAEECVTAAELIVTQLNNEQQTATNSVTSATDAKQKLQTALSTTTSSTRPEQSVTNLQVKQLQDSVRTAVNTIKTTVEEAQITLQKTEKQKKAVYDIVQEMKTLSTTEFIESNQIIKLLYSKADDALADATVAVNNAAKAKTDMTQEKQKADAALSSVATAKDVETAQEEVNTANECVNQANQFAAILKSALQTAKESVTSATDLKKKLEKALSTTTTAPSTVKNTEIEKANPPVGQGTEPDQKDTTIQPTSKELPDQSDNSADKVKDILINGAQNVLTTALTGEKAPAPGAKNDSAMTVSVPLLVALIASAVLQ